MKKRALVRAAVGSALAVTASLAVLPSSAQAVHQCRTNQICLYKDYDLQGSVLVISTLGTHNFTSNWVFYDQTRVNDKVSSIVNRSQWNVLACDNFDCQGDSPKAVVGPGERMNFKGSPGELKNDRMSAIQVTLRAGR
ncbi:peptidase inhibitor family I36 protein [Actinoplanes sp. NPDC000266]